MFNTKRNTFLEAFGWLTAEVGGLNHQFARVEHKCRSELGLVSQAVNGTGVGIKNG